MVAAEADPRVAGRPALDLTRAPALVSLGLLEVAAGCTCLTSFQIPYRSRPLQGNLCVSGETTSRYRIASFSPLKEHGPQRRWPPRALRRDRQGWRRRHGLGVSREVSKATATESGPNLYRINVHVSAFNLQFNHFLVMDDEPLLFHSASNRGGTSEILPASTCTIYSHQLHRGRVEPSHGPSSCPLSRAGAFCEPTSSRGCPHLPHGTLLWFSRRRVASDY